MKKDEDDDFIRENCKKLTWKFIQNSDYSTFLLNNNEETKKQNIRNNNEIESNVNEVFLNPTSHLLEKEDEDFINKVYSNHELKQKLNYDKSLFYSKIFPKNNLDMKYVKPSHISFDSNKRQVLTKRY